MNTRKFAFAVTAALSVAALSACGSSASEEPQEPPVETSEAPEEPEETVELDPAEMSGDLDQEQTQIFTEYALDKVDADICEFVHFTLPKEDLTGVVNLAMDVAGFEQGVESMSRVGVMRYAQEECDY